MTVHVAPVTAGERHELFDLFVSSIDASDTRRKVIKAGFAYATLGGVQQFIAQVGVARNWKRTNKQILAGIHHAITEPSALEALRSIPQSEVRVFVPGSRLRVESFQAKPVFHAKVLALSQSGAVGLDLLQAGSTNLTASAIGKKPHNYEFSVAVSASEGSVIDRAGCFDGWWTALWDQSRIVERRFIRTYAKLRRQVLDQNPILRSVVDVPESIVDARCFFAEVGAGSGPPGFRHQIEFPESLAQYFGPVERRRRDLTLVKGARSWGGRPLSYKQTTYGVEIWRLGMPTQTSGGPPIAERAIRFQRTAKPGVFEFEVADVGSSSFNLWRAAANLSGHIGATHGQRPREYGFY